MQNRIILSKVCVWQMFIFPSKRKIEHRTYFRYEEKLNGGFVLFFISVTEDYCSTRTASELWDGISVFIFIKLTTEPHLLTSDCSLAIWFRDGILS